MFTEVTLKGFYYMPNMQQRRKSPGKTSGGPFRPKLLYNFPENLKIQQKKNQSPKYLTLIRTLPIILTLISKCRQEILSLNTVKKELANQNDLSERCISFTDRAPKKVWLSPTVKAAHITEYNQTSWENYPPIATQVLKTYTGRQVCIHIYIYI